MDTTTLRHDELHPAPDAIASETVPLASLQAARKRYGSVTALDGVDLSVHAGEVVSLLGANGAGKSTAIGLLLGLLEPDAGDVRLFGGPPGSSDVGTEGGFGVEDNRAEVLGARRLRLWGLVLAAVGLVWLLVTLVVALL